MSKSSKGKFKIASPDAPLIKKLHKLIGNHVSCASQKKIIPQLYLLSNLHNMIQIQKKSWHYKVAEKLQKLYKYSDLLPIVLQIYLENYQTDPDLVSQFVKQKTAFHKTCMNKYDNYNFKQKDKTKQINISSYYVVETLCSTGRILSTPNCFDNCFFLVKQMMPLISISVKLYHWINVLEKCHKS